MSLRESPRKAGNRAAFYLLISPAAALLAFFFVYPALGALFFSMTDQRLVGQRMDEVSFVGLDNYARIPGDPAILGTLTVTATLILAAAALQQGVGYFLARALERKPAPFRRVVSACLHVGWLMPEVGAAYVFLMLFSVDGLANQLFFARAGAAEPWLVDHPVAVIALAQFWGGLAWSMNESAKAIRSLPEGIAETARIDGAGAATRLFRVEIPAIRRALVGDALLLALHNLGAFGLIYMLTGGGPLYRSTNLAVLVFRQSIAGSETGYGLALSFSLFCLGMLLSLIHGRLTRVGGADS